MGGLWEAVVCKIWTLAFCSTRFFAFSMLLQGLGLQKRRHGLYLLLFLFLFFTPILFIRTSQENLAATAALWAVALLSQINGSQINGSQTNGSQTNVSQNNVSEKRWHLFGAACFLSLSVSFRLQMGFSAFALGLWVVAKHLRSSNDLMWFTLGGALGLMPLAIVDIFTAGGSFIPAINYFRYANSGYEDGQLWGESPWHFYFVAYLTSWYPPLSLPLLGLILLGCRKSLLLAATIIPFVAMHVWLPHKEVRYMAPLVPFLCLAVFVGYEDLERRNLRILIRYFTPKVQAVCAAIFAIVAVAGFGWCFVALESRPVLTEWLKDQVDEEGHPSYKLVVNSMTGLPAFYFKNFGHEPAKITLDQFFKEAQLGFQLKGNFALFRVDLPDLQMLPPNCSVQHYATPSLVLWLFRQIDGVPRRKRVDAFVHCERKRSGT